jgi:hypothetical protein
MRGSSTLVTVIWMFDERGRMWPRYLAMNVTPRPNGDVLLISDLHGPCTALRSSQS